MPRITGSDVQGLMEAYNAVYAPQEITEEQIWEEVENWVNSLLEEGHDLSEYTWEDMYEFYINEDIKSFADRGGAFGALGRAISRSGTDAGKAQNRAAVSRFNQGVASFMNRGGVFGRGGAIDRLANKSANQPLNAKTNPSDTKNLKGLSIGTGGFNINGKPVKTAPADTTSPRSAGGTPSVKPPVAKTSPSTTPRPGTKAAGPESIKPKTPNPLMQKTFGYQTGNAPDQIAKASAGKPIPSGSALGSAANPNVRSALNLPSKPAASLSQAPEVKQTASLAATPKPTPVAPTPTQRRQGTAFREEVDAYDLVLDYLLENGHVDTLDEAHYVMLEMDAEMIQSIIEGSYEDRIAANNKKYDRNRQRAAQRAQARNEARARGENVGSPRTERTTYRDSAGVERHHSGARMPDKK